MRGILISKLDSYTGIGRKYSTLSTSLRNKFLIDDDELRDLQTRSEGLQNGICSLQMRYEEIQMDYMESRKEIKDLKITIASLRELHEGELWINRKKTRHIAQMETRSGEMKAALEQSQRSHTIKNIIIATLVMFGAYQLHSQRKSE